MAAIYFFRSATKMFFGQGKDVGNPPPMVFLDGYGSHYFPHVPCVISGFTHTLPNEVDYIQVPITTTTLEETAIQPDQNNFGQVQGMVAGVDYPNFGSKQVTNNTKLAYKSVTTSTRVPATSTIMINLKPVYSRKNLHERFNLDSFSKGLLLGDRGTGFGGFI
jgi:hypothetical protein